MLAEGRVASPLVGIRERYVHTVKCFNEPFEGGFDPLNKYVVVVKGNPGCGKSFVIVFWALKYVEANIRVMILVPFRRLALQLKDLFIALGQSPENLEAIQGKSPNMSGLESKSIIICTYEHAFHVRQRIGFCDAVAIDEVHNLYYPERGWQLESFFKTRRLLLCTGTLTKQEMSDLTHKLLKDPKRTVTQVHLRTGLGRFTRNFNIESFGSSQDDVMRDGGAFYFFPQKSSVIKTAYHFAKKMRMPLINPLSETEMILFPSCRDLITSFPQEGLELEEIPDSYLIRYPTVYIDFSSHFSPRIRTLLSTNPDCKINVFCTTTLCEGLNLLSLKTVIISGGLWDWRRIKQIEGRAGRFNKQVDVYKGSICFKKQEPLVLDLLDQITLELRKEIEEIRFYKKVSLEDLDIDTKDYQTLIEFLRINGFRSVQKWLQENFGISPNIKYAIIKKVRDQIQEGKILSRNPIILAALNNLRGSGDFSYKDYLSYFLPVLKIDYLDLSCLPEDDDE